MRSGNLRPLSHTHTHTHTHTCARAHAHTQPFTHRSAAVQPALDTDYVQTRMDNDDYTYNDCYEHREIMKHHVTLMMRRGDKETLFPLKGGKVTPGAYDRYNCEEAKNLNRMMPIQPKKTKAHNQVPYLRSAPLQGVVEYLQDYMISPIAVKAKDMPSGDVAWNNFPSVLYTAHAVYCALEGLIHLISHTSFT